MSIESDREALNVLTSVLGQDKLWDLTGEQPAFLTRRAAREVLAAGFRRGPVTVTEEMVDSGSEVMAWVAYRSDVGPNPQHLNRERAAFRAGWRAALEAALEAALGPVEEPLSQHPAIDGAIEALDFVADRMDDFAYDEIRSAIESIPDCESATAMPHEEHEPEWEYAVRWFATEGRPITDIGADREDCEALAEDQEGFAQAVRRRVGPWEPVEGQEDTR
ncbi:hypothetical protein [Microbacterium sp. gxy059]|uniref:hypothetical protein n=1 Tax=Microbacterium sp. gxy059 TaxID=2957199 RepID=UPI003D97807B